MSAIALALIVFFVRRESPAVGDDVIRQPLKKFGATFKFPKHNKKAFIISN